jgi:hypothetical protein
MSVLETAQWNLNDLAVLAEPKKMRGERSMELEKARNLIQDLGRGGRPSQEVVEKSRPKGIPAHAWPLFADYSRFPEMIGKPPAWWGWYKLMILGEDSSNPKGIVCEVHGKSYEDFSSPQWGHGPSSARWVFEGTPEAAEAALRLLSIV